MADQSSLSDRAQEIANTVTHVLKGRIPTWQAIRDLILPELQKVRQEALAEARAKPSALEGWRLVPKKPIPEQVNAGRAAFDPIDSNQENCVVVYAAMLAAAPEPPDE